MFKRYDYVIFNNGNMHGILTHDEGNGNWCVKSHWGGGDSMTVNESEMEKSESIPEHYQDIIDYYKKNEVE